MVLRRVRVRDEDRGDATRGELGDVADARPGDGQIAERKGELHPLDRRDHADDERLDAREVAEGRLVRGPGRQEDLQILAPREDRGRLARQLVRSEEHTSELQSPYDLVCRLL